MPGPLQGPVRAVSRRNERARRIRFVGSIDGLGARHRDGMAVSGTALRGHQVIVVIFLVDVRRLGAIEFRAAEDELAITDQAITIDLTFFNEINFFLFTALFATCCVLQGGKIIAGKKSPRMSRKWSSFLAVAEEFFTA